MAIELDEYTTETSQAPQDGVAKGVKAQKSGVSRGKKQEIDLNARDPFLTKIVVLVVIFVVGFASGVIVERLIDPPTDTVAQNETEATESADSAIMKELVQEVDAPQQEQPQKQAPVVEQKKEETPAPVVTPPAPEVAKVSATAYESLNNEEKADVKYLKSSDSWSSSKVKSPRFKKMFAQLNSGNIDCLDATFKGYDKEHVNGYVVKVIDGVKKLSPENREKAKKYLKEDKGEIKMSWAAKKIGEMSK